jgi:hypothetical protein
MENNKEVIKGEYSKYFWIFIFVIVFLITEIAAMMSAQNMIFSLVVPLPFFVLIYFILGTFHEYKVSEDTIKITFPHRTKKNITLHKEQIINAKFFENRQGPQLFLNYKNGDELAEFAITLNWTFEYIYDSKIYKILKRMKDWNVPLEVSSSQEELKFLGKKSE